MMIECPSLKEKHPRVAARLLEVQGFTQRKGVTSDNEM